jgi:hypothetical protein
MMGAFGQAGFDAGYGSGRRQRALQSQGQMDPYGNQVRQAMQAPEGQGGGFQAYAQPQQGAPGSQAAGGFQAYAPPQGAPGGQQASGAYGQGNTFNPYAPGAARPQFTTAPYRGFLNGVQYYNKDGSGPPRDGNSDHYDANGRLVRQGSAQFGNRGFAGSRQIQWDAADDLQAARTQAYDAFMQSMIDTGMQPERAEYETFTKYGARELPQDQLIQYLSTSPERSTRYFQDELSRTRERAERNRLGAAVRAAGSR